MSKYLFVFPFHYAVLLARISRDQRLLDSCYPQKLINYLIAGRCDVIRVNHIGVTEAADMFEDALRCFDAVEYSFANRENASIMTRMNMFLSHLA